LLLALVFAPVASGSPAGTSLSFEVFSRTGLPLGDVTWTGRRFVLATETAGTLATTGPKGGRAEPFAKLPKEVEEVRCVPSPGAHGWDPGLVFCHGPRGEIYRIAADGKVSVLAKLPDTKVQDGAATFDTAGGFGFALLAASGGSASTGGTVYAVRPDGRVTTVGDYPGPGGAENLELAPARFGSASGELLIAIDKDPGPAGFVLAMRRDGTVRTLATLPEGVNPIVSIGRGDALRGAAAPGLYLTDTDHRNVYFLSARQLRPYAGAVIVGGEKRAHLWILRATATGFSTVRVHSNLERTSNWNLEGATYVG
jgi:hypothetical protein